MNGIQYPPAYFCTRGDRKHCDLKKISKQLSSQNMNMNTALSGVHKGLYLSLGSVKKDNPSPTKSLTHIKLLAAGL